MIEITEGKGVIVVAYGMYYEIIFKLFVHFCSWVISAFYCRLLVSFFLWFRVCVAEEGIQEKSMNLLYMFNVKYVGMSSPMLIVLGFWIFNELRFVDAHVLMIVHIFFLTQETAFFASSMVE